jgi:hypothetical protein
MRELTKAMTSYAWAMTVFGAQQTLNMLGLGGNGSCDRSTRAFNNVTEAASQEVGDAMRSVFRSGDTLQRGMVDLMMMPLSLVNGGGGGNGRCGDTTRSDGTSPDSGRSTGWSQPGGNRWSQTAGEWANAAARTAAAGVDVMQSAVDSTARVARQAAGGAAVTPSSPAASERPGGWGPVPR